MPKLLLVSPTLLSFLLAWAATAALSLLACTALVRSFSWHARYTADAVNLGPQNRHTAAVPRVGGAAVALAMALSVLWLPSEAAGLAGVLLLAALPAFGFGLAEDTSRRVGAGLRLVASMASAVLAWLWLGAHLPPLGLPGIDAVIELSLVAFLVTVLLIAGVTNATNIIDGTNGLASGCVVIMGAATTLVAWQVGDMEVAAVAGMLAAAMLGFACMNYPGGRLYLGDGGAYFGGFCTVVLALLLVVRNPTVSPLLVFVLTAYPVTETLYSTWRRLMRHRRSAFKADRLHLHTLIQTRLLRCTALTNPRQRSLKRNARTAPYLWALSLCGALPCVLAWNSSAALWMALIANVLTYGLLYRIVVRGRAPAWLRQEPQEAAPALDAPSVLS